MNKLHLSRGIINKIFASLCVLLLFVYIVPHVVPHARANGSITVSNVVFDPTTGRIDFDYTGDNLTGHPSDVDIYDATITTEYWTNESIGLCTSSHCYATLVPITPDSGLTSVKLHVQITGGGPVDDSQTINYPLPLPTTNTPQSPTVGGWINVGETWTYASADAPTFTFTVSGDETGRYSPGMRIMLTQSSTKNYFIITAVSYSSPNTTVTVYGGTDYTLANSTISNTYYSMQKAPQGFPLDPAKWTEKVTDTTRHDNNSVTAVTWYNTNTSDKITIPIGSWNVEWSAAGEASCTSSTYCWYAMTLSTSTSSESDSDFSAVSGNNGSPTGVYTTLSRNKVLNLSSKTTYYLDEEENGQASLTGSIYNDLSPMILKATSAYL